MSEVDLRGPTTYQQRLDAKRSGQPAVRQTTDLLTMLKLYLGIDPGDNSQDEELQRALDTAMVCVETYLDRIVDKREVVEFFPNHFGTVTLHNLPVDTVIGVTVALNGVEQSDYSVYLNRGGMAHLTRIGYRLDAPMDWRTFDQVTVTYTAGYDPIPADLAQAIVYTAALLFQSEGSGTMPTSQGDVKTMSIHDVGSISYDVGSSSGGGGGTWVAPGVIPDTAAQMLVRYKRMFA